MNFRERRRQRRQAMQNAQQLAVEKFPGRRSRIKARRAARLLVDYYEEGMTVEELTAAALEGADDESAGSGGILRGLLRQFIERLAPILFEKLIEWITGGLAASE